MIKLFKVRMSTGASRAVEQVLSSGYIAQGKKVDEFEAKLQQELQTEVTPITTNSCTSAIDLALELCGVGPGDVVISTPQTCFASNVGIIHRGATIRWADIDDITGIVNPSSIEKLMDDKVKAIIAVNWAGKFANYKALKSFGVPVIEDAAHTWDTFLTTRPERGDYICYSLQAIKFLTAGDGGILITPPEKEQEARKLRWYGLDRTKNESFRITQNITQAGFKYNMNDISAVIGMANLPLAKDSVLKHRENAEVLSYALENLIGVWVEPYDETASYWVFPVIVTEQSRRDSFIEYLGKHGIEAAQVHYRNDLYDATAPFNSDSRLDGVEYFSEHQINIPCGWWLSKSDLVHIIKTIRDWDKIEYE